MTEQEAILYLKSLIGLQYVHRGNDTVGFRYGLCYGHDDEINVAIQALEKLAEIEMCIDACENCITYQGVKEFPESKTYEAIKKIMAGGVDNND